MSQDFRLSFFILNLLHSGPWQTAVQKCPIRCWFCSDILDWQCKVYVIMGEELLRYTDKTPNGKMQKGQNTSAISNETKFLMICRGGNSICINHLYVVIQSLRLSGMHSYAMVQSPCGMHISTCWDEIVNATLISNSNAFPSLLLAFGFLRCLSSASLACPASPSSICWVIFCTSSSHLAAWACVRHWLRVSVILDCKVPNT